MTVRYYSFLKEMFNRINIKLVLLQYVSLIFLICGTQRLYVSSQGSKYDAFLQGDWKTFRSLTSESVGQFLVNRAFWTFGFFIALTLIVGLINWENKIPMKYSFLNFVFIFPLFPLGIFSDGTIHKYLNYFGGFFVEDYSAAFFISGVILTIIGLIILFKSITLSK